MRSSHSASEALSLAFGTLDSILAADEAALAMTGGVGPVIAGSICRWYAIDANKVFVEKLRNAGVEFGKVEVSRMPQVLAGKAVVVTGTLERYSREEAELVFLTGKQPGRRFVSAGSVTDLDETTARAVAQEIVAAGGRATLPNLVP